MNKSEVLKLRMLWDRLLVFLGFRVWVKQMYARPRYQICAFHGCKMKLIRKTPTGARYLCKKCLKETGNPRKAIYHLEGCGSKVVPLWQKARNEGKVRTP